MDILAASEIPWDNIISGLVAVALAWIAYKQTVQAKETKAVKDNVDVVAAKVEEVHVATNSMKDQLVAVTEKEALARGGVDERNRADLEKMHKGEDTLKTVTSELAKLTAATDARVEGVGEKVEVVDAKVDQVHAAVVPEKKGGA